MRKLGILLCVLMFYSCSSTTNNVRLPDPEVNCATPKPINEEPLDGGLGGTGVTLESDCVQTSSE